MLDSSTLAFFTYSLSQQNHLVGMVTNFLHNTLKWRYHLSIRRLLAVKTSSKSFLNYLPDVEARSRTENRLAPASIALTDELLDAALEFDELQRSSGHSVSSVYSQEVVQTA